jgi:hypothetical protein
MLMRLSQTTANGHSIARRGNRRTEPAVVVAMRSRKTKVKPKDGTVDDMRIAVAVVAVTVEDDMIAVAETAVKTGTTTVVVTKAMGVIVGMAVEAGGMRTGMTAGATMMTIVDQPIGESSKMVAVDHPVVGLQSPVTGTN